MNQAADNSIPLLTEVISTPAVVEPMPTPARDFQPSYQPSFQPTYQHNHTAGFEQNFQPQQDSALLAPLPNHEQLQQIRQEIQDNVMQTMLEHLDNVLYHHLQDHLAVILDNMANILKARVCTSLEQALENSVTQALSAEMAKSENSKY